MEFLKIVLGCILVTVLYGIVHDQVTARVCVEYFTVFHPPVFATQSPTLLGLGWGVIATWWAGAIIGLLLATAARLGPQHKLAAKELAAPIGYLLLAMALCALTFGVAGYFMGVMPPELSHVLAADRQRRFLADWWAHSASYGCGIIGGLILCVLIAMRRMRLAQADAA